MSHVVDVVHVAGALPVMVLADLLAEVVRLSVPEFA